MILFAYNFKHKKTQDFIFYCLQQDIKMDLVLAADPVKLNIPKSTIRTKLRHKGLIHPADIATSFKIPYEVAPHNSEEAKSILEEIQPDIGLIAGARILKRDIIDKFRKGIINFHPGLIPEARGLDALLWSIYHNIPLGVTSHIIDHRIDAGKILEISRLKLFLDDTLFDLSERLYETQLEMIRTSYDKLEREEYEEFNVADSSYNRKMPPEIEARIENKLLNYLSKHSA